MSDPNAALSSLDSPAVRDLIERINACALEYSSLYSPLPEEAVDAFERKYKVSLPEDYRFVVTRLANGVRGILFPLGKEQMRGEDYTREYDDLGFVGDLSQLFPHREAWNPPESSLDEPVPPPDATPEEKERLVEEWRRAMEDTFGNMSYVNGAIAISTRGCGQVMWLVVNGAQKGTVWDDSISDGLELFPLCDASGRPMTFTNWLLSELRVLL